MTSRSRARAAAALVAGVLAAGVPAAACAGRPAAPASPGGMTSPAATPSSARQATRCAWVVGTGGVIVATTDGGANWSKQSSGTSDDLTGVSFADADGGWAVGAAPVAGTMTGHVLSTFDGGGHWELRPAPDGDVLVAVESAGAGRVCAAGARGATAVIVTSTDGGVTWATAFTAASIGYVVGLTFADADHGWAVTTTGTILGTTDGGAHWAKQAAPRIGVGIDGIACCDALNCWVVGRIAMGSANPEGPFSRIFATTDGGATWKKAPPPQDSFAGLRAVALTSPRHVCVFGGEGIWVTTDGGVHWKAARPVGANATNAAAFSNAAHGWAVWSYIFATTDGGFSWHKQLRPMGAQFVDIACPRSGGGATK